MRNELHKELPTAERPSQAEQDYLKAIHQLGGSGKRVHTQAIADLLMVRAPSVTGMLKRLKIAGWISYKPRDGACLTQEGIIKARVVIRRHRLVELLLTRVLGLDWSEVDAEAEMLEHVVSPRLEAALAACLGEPLEDPHGHPIPTRDGSLEERQLRPVSDFRPGQWVIIREVDDSDPESLRHWKGLGLIPGQAVLILSYQFVEDIIEIKIGDIVVPMKKTNLGRMLGEFANPLKESRAA